MTNGALPLDEVRPRMAAALAPASDSDPDVLANYEDTIEPPALMLEWLDPWLEPQPAQTAGRTFGPCYWLAHIAVRCVSGRLEPTPGIETLERLVSFTLNRLRSDSSYQWPPALVSTPRIVVFGDVRYQAAQVQYAVTVTTGKDGNDG